jgi:hypothetical protein
MFYLLKKKIQPYISLIKMVIFSACFLLIIFLWLQRDYYKNQVKAYQDEKVLAEQQFLTEKAQLETQIVSIEKDWKEQRNQANEAHTAEIQRLNDMYNERLRDVNRVQYRTQEIIKYLPDASRSAVEEIAKTTTNGVKECSAILVEVESVARQYSAEIDQCIASYPKPIKLIDSR